MVNQIHRKKCTGPPVYQTPYFEKSKTLCLCIISLRSEHASKSFTFFEGYFVELGITAVINYLNVIPAESVSSHLISAISSLRLIYRGQIDYSPCSARLIAQLLSSPPLPAFPASSPCPREHDRAKVVYDIEGFLEKNNDSLHDNLLDLLDATVDPFLRRVVEFVDPEAGSESRSPPPPRIARLLRAEHFPQKRGSLQPVPLIHEILTSSKRPRRAA